MAAVQPSFVRGLRWEHLRERDTLPAAQVSLITKLVAIRRLLIALDVATLVASMVVAYSLQPLLRGVLPGLKSPAPLAGFVTVAYLTLPVWLLLIGGLGLHRTFERSRSFVDVLVGLFKLHVFGVLGLALVDFLAQVPLNRSIVALFVLTSFTSMATVRWLLSLWIGWQHETGRGRERVLIVGGPGPELQEFLSRARGAPLPPGVVGYLGPGDDDEALPPRLGDPGALREVLHEQAVDQVIFFPPFADPNGAAEAIAACEELGVAASFTIGRVGARPPPHLLSVYETPVVSYIVSPKSTTRLLLKQAFDLLVATVVLLLCAPLLLLVSLGIALSMGRPILFSQERVGLNGRRFRMYKFRTMVQGAEAMQAELGDLNETQGVTFKARNDPRVTPFGRFLRRSSIDELPQLFNVLEGTMSLVGPRPLPVQEQQRIYGGQRRRLSMKPGITGLWQVSGRSDIGFDDWMRLDLEYVDRWSLSFDLTILLRTIPAVLLRRGAR